MVETLVSVSVVVSAYTTGRLNDVLDCISSLKRQTFPAAEIILVLDPREKLVDFYKPRVPSDVKIIMSDDVGLSHARNAGIKKARGEIVAFIDDDAIADEEWLENLVRNYEDPHVLGVGGFIKPVWERKRPRWFPEELYWILGCSYKGLPKKKAYVRNPIGCNMSFRKDAFEKVGYFSTGIGRLGKKLIANEETEFCIRVWKQVSNSKIVYDPSVVVYHTVHKGRTTVTYLLKRSFYEGFSKALISRSKSNPLKTLSTEDRYLKYLLKVVFPSRLRRIHKFKSICHLVVLFISVCSVLMGYSLGFVKKYQTKIHPYPNSGKSN